MFNRRIGIVSSLMALMAGLGAFTPARRGERAAAPTPPPNHHRSRASAGKRWKPRGPANRVYCRADAHKPVKYVPSIVRIDGIAHRHQDGQLVLRVKPYFER